ncbi:MAG TPA: LptF/LptG family permease, partial [Tepidisphaeraceae bacterium]
GIITELTRERAEQAEGRQKTYALQNMQDSNGHLLFASRYTPPTANSPAVMDEISVLQVDDSHTRAELLSARKAIYDPALNGWALEGGEQTTGLGSGPRRRRAVEPVAVYQSNITPEEIALYKSGDFVDLLSTPRINELLQRTQIYGANDLLRVKHSRLAQLLINIIMVLLAIAAVLIREPGQLRYAVMKCLILVGACMATAFICQSLADHPPAGWAESWPALMAWTPIFLFGPLSVFLIDRVKT